MKVTCTQVRLNSTCIFFSTAKMNSTGAKFETLNKDNYDTWKIQMRAILIKNDAWGYVSGSKPKPTATEDDATPSAAIQRWEEADEKAQSDIVLAISPTELKGTKGCKTAAEIWRKLESLHQSKGPVRKAALLNHLLSLQMRDGDDPREHSRRFSDTVDKLAELDIEIHQDALVIMLLRSLPESLENFRCAISSRDELPSLETLYIKLAEEFDARKDPERDANQTAMFARKPKSKPGQGDKNRRGKPDKRDPAKSDAKMKCFKCQQIGHRAKNCPKVRDNQAATGDADGKLCFLAAAETAKVGSDGDRGT